MTHILKVASSKNIDIAYRWVCKRRKKFHYNDKIWHLRFFWHKHKLSLTQTLIEDRYHLSPLKLKYVKDRWIEVWDCQDVIVLRAISQVLSPLISKNVPKACVHLKNNGGLKKAVEQVYERLPDYQFVFKSDIDSYYASIRHDILLLQLKKIIKDKIILRLLEEYCMRLVDIFGYYRLVERGISLGCSLSPLMGALYLSTLDHAMTNNKEIFYLRYMDDWIVLTRTKSQLKKIIRKTNEILEVLDLKKHPDKTTIGKISHGFNFLGYEFTLDHLRVSEITLTHFMQRFLTLFHLQKSLDAVFLYVKRWHRWVKSGLKSRFSFLDSL